MTRAGGAPPGEEDAPLPWTGSADKASYYRLLVAHSAAGWLGATLGLPATFVTLGVTATAAPIVASLIWPMGGRPTAPQAAAPPPRPSPH